MSGLSLQRILCCLLSFPYAIAQFETCTTGDANSITCLDDGRGSSLVQISRASPLRPRKAVWEISLPISRLGTPDNSEAAPDGLEQTDAETDAEMLRQQQGTALAETDATGGMSSHAKRGTTPDTSWHPHMQGQDVTVPTYVHDKPTTSHGQDVAVPMHVHDKPTTSDANVSGNSISEALGNDLLGDSLEPTHKGVGKKKDLQEGHHGHEHREHHGHVALLYFIFDLIAGAIILFFLERVIPNCPYTVALFIAGCIMGLTHYIGVWETIWPSWYLTVTMWESINPHMLFFGFLPTLIFGEAMRLNAQLVKQCVWQILLLACPGVLIGTFLTGAFAVYVLPYGWDWPIALVFGATLSATDPVAVVALFNTLGVSPRLTMLISGESLLNDGTAMAVFALMLKTVLGAQINSWNVAVFFAHMTITSVVWGCVLGIAACFFISLCAEEKQPSDLMLQVIVTICASYMAFFVAESELSTSGVLATVACGYQIALNGWPRFVSIEAVKTVWEAIEFIGNTVIFFLAGLLFVSNVINRREYIGFSDMVWLFILYIALTAIRGIMLLLLLPALNACGAPISKKEAIVMVWSGLRGAVALAMAIIVDREPDVPAQTGSRIMFHIGGLAALTTLVNATTTAPLLRWLDLTQTNEMKERCLSAIASDIHVDISHKFQEKMAGHEDLRCQGANEDLVRAMVPALQSVVGDDRGVSYPCRQPLPASMTQAEKDEYKASLTQIYRSTFLQVVRTHYWEAIEECMVPKCGLTARFLLESVDEAMEQTWGSLNDWSALERKLDLKVVNQPPSFLSRLFDSWPFSLSSDLRGYFSKERAIERVVQVGLTFMEVHTRAQKEVPHLFVGTVSRGSANEDLDEAASQTVIKESRAQFQRVIEVLNILPTTSVEVGKSKMFARELLCLQSKRLQFMQQKGFLTDMEVSELEHEIHVAIRKLLHTKHADWLTMKKSDGSSVGLE